MKIPKVPIIEATPSREYIYLKKIRIKNYIVGIRKNQNWSYNPVYEIKIDDGLWHVVNAEDKLGAIREAKSLISIRDYGYGYE